MNPICRLSDNTKRYLEQFYCILDEMTAAMTGAELTESISCDFMIQMIPHHRAAVKMSENLLLYTTFLPLQNLAQNIIREQNKSIKQMQAVLPCCSQLCNCIQDQCLYSRRTGQIMDKLHQQQLYPRDDPAPSGRHPNVGKRAALFDLSGTDPDSGDDYLLSEKRCAGNGAASALYRIAENPKGHCRTAVPFWIFVLYGLWKQTLAKRYPPAAQTGIPSLPTLSAVHPESAHW